MSIHVYLWQLITLDNCTKVVENNSHSSYLKNIVKETNWCHVCCYIDKYKLN